MIYFLVMLLLFIGMLVYNKIANRYLIMDVPNPRSSHTESTIRGGGIIFVFSYLISGAFYPQYWLPVVAVVIIGIVSFLDDQIDLSKKLRILFQTVTVAMLFYFLEIHQQFNILGILALLVLVVGVINAFNFMDGINGITGLYSLVVLGGLQAVNLFHIQFIEPDLIWFPMLSCLAFLYFNFRRKALCFPGDVGSITIGFWIIFLLLKVIVISGNWNYLLFISVYGVDTILTIIQRLYLRQNIFVAHRIHFFQILANEKKISHLIVSTLYAVVQLLIIVYTVCIPAPFLTALLVTTLPLVVLYVGVKIKWLKEID